MLNEVTATLNRDADATRAEAHAARYISKINTEDRAGPQLDAIPLMRILIVEDDSVAAGVLAKGLREHAYAVDVTADGPTALEHASVCDYDLILLDVLLPGFDGLDVCRRLRADGVKAPVLMLTALGEPDQRVRGLDVGADDYLAKPYHFPELLARIRALLRRGPALVSAVLTARDLTIDTRARGVQRAGRSIQLTAKEYTLLEYLARRQGEVVGRADIAEHVWDDSFDPLSNLIEVYIQRLRRKIDDGHALKLLHTHRGAGYSLQIDKDKSAED
jgi:two-component system copper resistance phosphate regulon response regulator CusR